MPWQLQEAKQKFSKLVQRALTEGPQAVTRHGETAVVVVSAEEFQRLTGGKPDFIDFLLSCPDFGQLEIERATDRPRDVEL